MVIEKPGLCHADCPLLWKASNRYGPDTACSVSYTFSLLKQAPPQKKTKPKVPAQLTEGVIQHCLLSSLTPMWLWQNLSHLLGNHSSVWASEHPGTLCISKTGANKDTVGQKSKASFRWHWILGPLKVLVFIDFPPNLSNCQFSYVHLCKINFKNLSSLLIVGNPMTNL